MFAEPSARIQDLRAGDDCVINGRKWWSSGAGVSNCAIFILMGKTDPDGPRHSQQSMVLVPRDTPGVTVLPPLHLFGYDDAPHGHMEIVLDKVARAEIAVTKLVAPDMSCKAVDWASQAHGAAGVSQVTWLAEAYAHQRTVRIVDGADEVHRNAIATIELGKYAPAKAA